MGACQQMAWLVTVLAVAAFTAAGAENRAPAPATIAHVPLKEGLTLISALHFPDGDRENVVTVTRSNDAGVTYAWHAFARAASGERSDAEFTRFVSAADLANATRLNTVFRSGDQQDYPGYTAFTISSAVYESLRAAGTAAFTVTALPDPGIASVLPGLVPDRRIKGALSRVAPQPEPFPLLVNGHPALVPALRVHGSFASMGNALEQDFWVLADSVHPLILKTVTGKDVLQVVRVETPGDDELPAALAVVERLLDQECRAELPGIYFAFGTAELDPVSNDALAQIATMLTRHPQWTFAVEGHTDNIGTDAANQLLSQERAQAVQGALTERGVAATRLQARGYGASRPRQTNATLEGRARNRRVELVRSCSANSAGGHS